MKVIAGFVGWECEDIVLYLAKIWSFLGNKVVISDRTAGRSAFGMCGFLSPDTVSESYGDIEITVEESAEADVLLKVLEAPFEEEVLKNCQSIYLVTDETVFHVSQLAKAELGDCPCYLIIKNAVSLKYGEAYLKLMSGQNIEGSRFIPLDERDVMGKCLLATERGTPLKKLSTEMKEILCEIVLSLDGAVDKKTVRRALERG